MKLNSSINLQNNTWNGTKKHILRTFEDYKNGSHQDKNKNINPNLSKYNLSTDGKIIEVPKYKKGKLFTIKKFIKFNKNLHRMHQDFIHKVNSQYSDYIHHHNSLKSVKKNPQRRYKSAYWYLFQKGKKTPQKQLLKHEKTFSQPIGNTKSNNKMIKLIQRKNHWNYKKARNNYLNTMSHAIFKAQMNFNNSYKYLYMLHVGTNADELVDNKYIDGIHSQGSLIGLGKTKTGRPTLDFGKALCNEFNIKWSDKRIKQHGHYINKSESQALSKFNDAEAKRQLTYISHALYNHYHIKQFKHITFSRTYSKHTGQTQRQYQYHQKQKQQAQKRKMARKKQKRKIMNKHRHNAINRKRTYHRQYMKHYRAEKRLQKQSRVIKKKLTKNKHLNHLYILSIRDEHKIIKHQQTEIKQNRLTLHHQQSLLAQLPNIIKKKKNELRSFSSTLIASTFQTLHQNAKANISNITALSSANDKTISRANKIAHQGILGRIKNTFDQFKSNYKSTSASKSQSQAKQSSYNSVIDSIASPVIERRQHWDDAINYLEQKENHGGLYLNEHHTLESLQQNPPSTVAQYSNSIQNQTGMNLIQSSASSASSYAKAKPSIIASQKSITASLSSEHNSLIARQRKIQQQAEIETNKRLKIKEHQREEINKKQELWITKHPKEFVKKLKQNHQGPQI